MFFLSLLATFVQVPQRSEAPRESESLPPLLTTGFARHTYSTDFTAPPRSRSTNHLDGCRVERAQIDAAGGGLLLHPELGREASIELPLRRDLAFTEFFASWNVVTPPGTAFGCEVRVAQREPKRDGDEFDDAKEVLVESPWLWLGDWGTLPELERITKFDGGRVDVDVLETSAVWRTWTLRLRAFRTNASSTEPVRIERIDATIADRRVTHDAALLETARYWHSEHIGVMAMPEAPPNAVARIPVPFRSQRAEADEIAGRICSPTSVAMVLAHRGVDVPTRVVAERAYDRAHEMYGNWPRAVQTAFSYGVPGYLTRCATWSEAEWHLRAGIPLVISIAAKKGELTGAPYAQTNGHLLVLCGFDPYGDALVNDPAAKDAEHGVTKYARAELERCWMGHGGVAYVLLPRTKDSEAASAPR